MLKILKKGRIDQMDLNYWLKTQKGRSEDLIKQIESLEEKDNKLEITYYFNKGKIELIKKLKKGITLKELIKKMNLLVESIELENNSGITRGYITSLDRGELYLIKDLLEVMLKNVNKTL